MKFYNINTIPDNIVFPDIYFTPEYGKACEYSDNAIWECCIYKDLMYIYLKIEMKTDTTFYKLITPYGYSGYYFKKLETYNEFILKFQKESIKKNYIVEILRQNPYINTLKADYKKNYKLLLSKSLYSIQYDNFLDYYTFIHKSARNKYKKALTLGFIFDYIPCSNSNLMNNFIKLYEFTMNKLNAKEYYYFSKKYFEELFKLKYTKLAIVNYKQNIIGISILFEYKNYIHYHLSCNDKSFNCITDFMLLSIIKKMGPKKQFFLGCGLKKDDNLDKFKKKFSNTQHEYHIYEKPVT
jgi:hypothetical protein